MIFPVIYACVVWYAAMRWRRRWQSFASVGLAVAVLCVLGIGLRSAPMMMEFGTRTPALTGPLRNPVVEALLWPYTAMVMAVGVYIACLPRSAPSEAHCVRCHYDLVGMDPEGLVCPECGLTQEYKCLACGSDLRGLSPVGLKCPDCCTMWGGPGWRGIGPVGVAGGESGAELGAARAVAAGWGMRWATRSARGEGEEPG